MSDDLFFSSFIDDATAYAYPSIEERKKAHDIVNVMLSIFDGDITTSGDLEFKMPRKIYCEVEVYEKEAWENVKAILTELVDWVSGDHFNINFEPSEKGFQNFLLCLPSDPRMECITLFSGGLDSLAGASYNFENQIVSDYVGYINKAEEKKHQVMLRGFYNKVFAPMGSEIDIKNKYQRKKQFYFQSTRSLLYLSLAVSKALSKSIKEIRMYENGILSLNPEFGRYTTKTTHPKTISLYNELLFTLGYDIQIINKFDYSTKGEVINNMNEDFKNQISNTFTCGKGRAGTQDNHTGQCGVCVPCVLRKISLAAYDNEQFDTAYYVKYDSRDCTDRRYSLEYKKNIGYFEAYVEAIKNDEIFGQISSNYPKFHMEPTYLIKQKAMFETFVKEFERFKEKYEIS